MSQAVTVAKQWIGVARQVWSAVLEVVLDAVLDVVLDLAGKCG